MVDTQSATAEIRRGNKKRRKKIEETTGQKYNAASATPGGHKKSHLKDTALVKAPAS